jgi:hypothetical protein
MDQTGTRSENESGDGDTSRAHVSLVPGTVLPDFESGLTWEEAKLPREREEAQRERDERRDHRLRVPAARRDPVPPRAVINGARCGTVPVGADGKPEVDFFDGDPRERDKAKLFCMGCPVRRECMEFALYTMQLWGVWGGIDEHEIRRTLSVDAYGSWKQRSRAPRCPMCHERDIVKDGFIYRCGDDECGMSWPRVPRPRRRRQVTFMGGQMDNAAGQGPDDDVVYTSEEVV